ncbi:MAG TPA: SpdA protein [Streptomyces sp.]|nr:SpdA protein [Streptomyces sp.]
MRSLRFDAVLVQAVIAGALSFAHLHDIAAAAGQDGWKAWAYPISVDLLLVAAWRRLRLLRQSGGAVRAAWTWFTVALAASLGANVATAELLDLNDVPDWLRILVAGWPALAFLGGTLLAHSPATADEPETETKPVEVPTPSQPAPVIEPTPPPALSAPEPEPASEPVPVETPEPVPSPTPAPSTPVVPAALVEHARKVADTHRTQTGRAIDTDTLRARLGVPAPLADQIAAQLT